jgi:hypothetical protein
MWGHSLHRLAPYNGTFPAALARYFIQAYSDPGQTVLDPFSGSGTTALEACICFRRGIGSDPFPYANLLTHAKVRPLDRRRAEEAIRWLVDNLPRTTPSLENEGITPFFHAATLRQILRVRAVLKDDITDRGIFLKALMCGVLHGPSKMFLSLPMKDTAASSPRYIENYARDHHLEYPVRDISESLHNKLRRALEDSPPPIRGSALSSDARHLALEDESVDLIVTSPPYLHVLDYSWNHWVRLWFLGADRLQARKTMFLSGNEPKFLAFMGEVLNEMYRVLAPNSACVIVIGDVRSKSGPRVLNAADHVSQLAESVGFGTRCVIADPYPLGSRSFVVYNESRYGVDSDTSPSSFAVPMDRCIVLQKGEATERTFRTPWQALPNRSLESFEGGPLPFRRPESR